MDGLATVDVCEDEGLIADVSAETSLTVLGDNWSVACVIVSEVEIIEVDLSNTFTRVPVTLVGSKTL